MGATGLQGRDLLPRGVFARFDELFKRLLPGWGLNGACNFTANLEIGANPCCSGLHLTGTSIQLLRVNTIAPTAKCSARSESPRQYCVNKAPEITCSVHAVSG